MANVCVHYIGQRSLTIFIAKMSSTLVSYSSGEEDEDKSKRHPDANYDDVQMDMSDDNDEKALPSEAAMFSSKEDHTAYRKQFSNSSSAAHGAAHGTSEQPQSSSEYGSSVAATSASDRHQSSDRQPAYDKQPAAADRQPRRSTDDQSNHSSTSRKVEDPGDEHSRNNKDRRRDHEDSRRRRHHKDGGFQRRDRSRSRDRGQHRRRRSRSRERDEHRGHRDRRQSRDDDSRRFRPTNTCTDTEQERQDSRSRKLQSLGLVNQQGETLASQMEKVKEMTGVEVPKYYNPAAINPLRYAEQIKKRQMLWKKSGATSGTDDTEQQPSGSSSILSGFTAATPEPGFSTPEKNTGAGSDGGGVARQPSQPSQSSQPAGSFNQWETTNLGNDKANDKFRRLMGIKSGSSAAPPTTETPSSVKGSAKLFEMQEQQYEKARAITHTARGLGLGFTPAAAVPPAPSTSALPPPGNASSLNKRDLVSCLKK